MNAGHRPGYRMSAPNSLAQRFQKSIAHLLEERSPAASRAFLTAASSLATPFTIGMGLTIERLNDLGCVARLPDWWRNRDQDGTAHPAAVAALAQMATRSYWDRHLDPAVASARLARLDCRFLRAAAGPLRAECTLAEDAREEILFRLRGQGRVEAACVAHVFDSSGHRVAEVDVEWEFAAAPLLAAAKSSN